MRGKSYWMAGVAAVALVASAGAGLAKSTQTAPPPAQTGPSNSELSARIDALEAELQAANDHRDSDHTRLSALEQNFNDTSWSFDNGRPTVKSGDGRFTMAFRVRFQSDFAGFMQDTVHPAGFAGPADLSSGAVMRRVYFGIEGKVFNDFAYELRLNGGGINGDMVRELDNGLWEIQWEERLKGMQGDGVEMCTLDAQTVIASFGGKEILVATPPSFPECGPCHAQSSLDGARP